MKYLVPATYLEKISGIRVLNEGGDCWHPKSINIKSAFLNVSGLKKEWFKGKEDNCIEEYHSDDRTYILIPKADF